MPRTNYSHASSWLQHTHTGEKLVSSTYLYMRAFHCTPVSYGQLTLDECVRELLDEGLQEEGRDFRALW